MTAPISPLSLLMDAMMPMPAARALKDRTPVEARVLEMAGKSTARLSILGTTVEVHTPVLLTPGTTLSLRLEQAGGQLRLILEQPETSTTARSPGLGAAVGDADVGAPHALADARAMIGKALVDASISTASLPPALPLPRPMRDTGSSSLHYEGPDDEETLRTGPSGEIADRRSAASPSPAEAPRDSALRLTQDITRYTFAPGGGLEPFDLYVAREQENQAERGGARAPLWTVRFAFQTLNSSNIQATVSLGASGIGVQLNADRSEAAFLQNELSDLRDTLTAAGLEIDQLVIHTIADAASAAGSPSL